MQTDLRHVPVVILCGGQGMRLREETAFRPKPLIEIGGMPILWHIMKWYGKFGCRHFVLCLGYRKEMIKDFFLNYEWRKTDFRLSLRTRATTPLRANGQDIEDWDIDFVDTGEETNTGGRVYHARPFVGLGPFFLTYGDGVADVDLERLWRFHLEKGRVVTITGLHPWSKYGQIDVDQQNIVSAFREKPRLRDLINGGFFVFEQRIFDYLDPDCVLEREPFERLAADREIALFRHEGFWHAMDTYKDVLDLNQIWEQESCPWRQW